MFFENYLAYIYTYIDMYKMIYNGNLFSWRRLVSANIR